MSETGNENTVITETITEKDVKTFQHGWCHVLAHEIQEITGWPIHAFFTDDSLDPLIHAFNVTPEGRIVDINGVQTREDFERRWDLYFVEEHGDSDGFRQDRTCWEDIESAWEIPKRQSVWRRAREIAPLLVERADQTPSRKAERVG
jgi:hypothetical protein